MRGQIPVTDHRRGSAGPIDQLSPRGVQVGTSGLGYCYDAATGRYCRQVPVQMLLGSDDTAAVAMVLRVEATATDGYQRQAHLDAPLVTTAFALEPW